MGMKERLCGLYIPKKLFLQGENFAPIDFLGIDGGCLLFLIPIFSKKLR